MSGPGTSDAVIVKASNNIYTVLAAVALIAALLALFAVWSTSQSLFGGLFSGDVTPRL